MARRGDVDETAIVKELRRIRDLLIVLLLKSGATSEQVDHAAKMGAANIRARFPVSGKTRKKRNR
jgi:hypothetical protein